MWAFLRLDKLKKHQNEVTQGLQKIKYSWLSKKKDRSKGARWYTFSQYLFFVTDNLIFATTQLFVLIPPNSSRALTKRLASNSKTILWILLNRKNRQIFSSESFEKPQTFYRENIFGHFLVKKIFLSF